MATNSNDKDKKIRFATILEDVNNIHQETQANTAYLDDKNRLCVKRENIHGIDWNIEDSIKDKFHAEYNNQQSSDNYRREIYGFCLDMNETNPEYAMTYTDMNSNYIPLSIKQREKCNYGSWKEFISRFVGCRPVALYEDGNVYRYLDPDDYSKDIDGNSIGIDSSNAFDEKGRPYNIMIEFKHNWYRMYVKNNKFYFQVANYKVNEDFIDDAFLFNGRSMNYLYVSAFTPEFHIINSVEKIKSVYEKDYFQDHYLFRDIFYDNSPINSKVSISNQRKNLMENYINSSTFGYAQFLYILLLCELVTKQTNYGNMMGFVPSDFDVNSNATGLRYSADKSYYIDPSESYNKGLFYSDMDFKDKLKNNELNFNIRVIKLFGIPDMFFFHIIDGLYYIASKSYYQTAPYNIEKLSDINNTLVEMTQQTITTELDYNKFKHVVVLRNKVISFDSKSYDSNISNSKISIPYLINLYNQKYSSDYISNMVSSSECFDRSDGLLELYVERYPINERNYGKKCFFCQFK